MAKHIVNRAVSKAGKILRKKMSEVSYKSRTLSVLYYFLFDKSFAREQQAVLAGKVKHLRETEELNANYFLLVRNVHRIEKGLLMRPQRAVFAKDYVKETIDSFDGVWKLHHKDSANSQLKWFYDVLSEYFNCAGDKDEFIHKQGKRFRQIVETNSEVINLEAGPSTIKSIPYHRLESSRSKIDYDEFYSLCRQRRSVRWFLDKPVPREFIDKAVLAANQAPSACNRQPFEFRIIDNKDEVNEVVQYPMGTTGYGHSIPVMIVIIGNLDAYFDERDRHVIYIDASLASMTLMLALETMGLSSCSINWPDMEEREKKMEKFLKLEKHQRPIMCLGLGYPDQDGKVAFSEKRPLDHIRKYN